MSKKCDFCDEKPHIFYSSVDPESVTFLYRACLKHTENGRNAMRNDGHVRWRETNIFDSYEVGPEPTTNKDG